MLRWFIIFGLAGTFLGAIKGASLPRYTGAPIVQWFTERDLVGSPHTRRIAVHPCGLVYAANVQGITEYDGVSWKLISGTEGLIVHNLGIDSVGRVWYGAKNQFGVLVPDAHGVLATEPWQTKLPPKDQAIGHVLNMAVNDLDVYFVTQGVRSFITHVDAQGRLHQIAAPDADERFATVFVSAGVTYAVTTTSVYRIEGETLQPAPDAQGLAAVGVQSVWSREGGGAWMISAAGLRIWSDGHAPLVSDEVKDFLKGDRVLSGCPLRDGRFALGTKQSGLLLIDSSGHVLTRYDEDSGLGDTSNRIEAMAPDGDGGLWLALYSGITRIQVETPVAIHNLSVGIRGRIESFAYHQGRLHVGTTHGVFVRDPDSGRFSPLPQAGVDAWGLLSTPDGLIIGGDDLRLIHPDGALEIIESERLLFRSILLLPRDPNRLVASTGPGQLRVYHRVEGKWRFESQIPAVRDVLFDLSQDSAGWLWAAFDNRRSVARLDWRKGVRTDAALEIYGPSQGLPVLPQQRRNLGVFLIDGKVEITSLNGLWRHDEAKNCFVPETRIEGFDPQKWSRVYPLRDGSLWLATGDGGAFPAIARRTGSDTWHLEPLPYLGLESIEPRSVFEDLVTQTVWIGYQRLASYDLAWRGPRTKPPITHLRSVCTADGEILWGGSGAPFQTPLPAAKNSLRFEFAADEFQPDAWGQVTVRYRTRLAGFDTNWSPWSNSAYRDYSNLPPGNYSFHAQAQDNAGREGPESEFAFTLLPPWWRTWWAYGGYGLVSIFAVGGFVRLRTGALRARASALEGEVELRTEQLARQNIELGRLLRLELDEKIAARLAEEKARLELLRYQLNPHFLFNTLASISSAIPSGGEIARAMVLRLGEFCRLALYPSGDREWTTLGDDLHLLRTYLEIEKSRWGELLHIEIHCSVALETVRIPQFLLLPLVENALKYGRATSPDRVEVRLTAHHDPCGFLILTVANTGEWIEPTANRHLASLRIGLDNLRERLGRYYPGEHDLALTHAGGWITATLRIPLPAIA